VHGLKELTGQRYSYAQAHIETLFDEKLTSPSCDCLRFNPLDCQPGRHQLRLRRRHAGPLRLDHDQLYRCETERKDVYRWSARSWASWSTWPRPASRWTGTASDTEPGRFDFFYQQMETRTRKLFEEAAGRDLTTLNFRSAIQMRQLLFEDLGLHSTRMTKPNKDGEQNLSTDETALEALRHQHPAVDQLLKYRQVKKMGEWFQLWTTLRHRRR
jgi:hypothetical protein